MEEHIKELYALTYGTPNATGVLARRTVYSKTRMAINKRKQGIPWFHDCYLTCRRANASAINTKRTTNACTIGAKAIGNP